jgi:hypothetical protein
MQITVIHPENHGEAKVFTFEASYQVCDELVKKISDYITGASNKNCFVATVVYESNDCTQLDKLRQWRDNCLFNYSLGRRFIKLYYRYGENLSIIVDKRPILKKSIKKILDSFVSRL